MPFKRRPQERPLQIRDSVVHYRMMLSGSIGFAQRGLGRRACMLAVAAVLGAMLSPSLKGQWSEGAYRALGQPNLRENGMNSLSGSELWEPNGIAWDNRSGKVRIYVSDTRNHRIVAWDDVDSLGNGAPSSKVLGQPSPSQFQPLGIGNKGLAFPLGLAVNPVNGDLFCADFGNNRVLRFPAPLAEGSGNEPNAVYGQPDFATNAVNIGGIGAGTLNGPRAVAFDSLGNLWIADTGNHRVLRIPAAALDLPNPEADIVIGQTAFGSASPNGGQTTANSSGLDRPAGIAFDSKGNLSVSDFNNARILTFAAPLVTGKAANLVLGQADFTSRVAADRPSATRIAGPAGLSIAESGELYVAIPNDHRVLVFEEGAALEAAASRVLGQLTFGGALPNVTDFPLSSASTLRGVSDVQIGPGGRAFVADSGNNRVLSYPPGGNGASLVLGQADFQGNGPNRVKSTGIDGVYDVAIDYSASPFALYVSDTDNHRVLIWRDSSSFLTGAGADLVIGQPSLTSGHPNVDRGRASNPTATSLSSPKGLVLDTHGNLYVADSGNNRVLWYLRPVDQTGRITADAVIGQPNFGTSDSSLVGAGSLNQPAGLALGPSETLFVADAGNHRVLEFPGGLAKNQFALRVFGQPDFNRGSAPTTVSAQTLTAPEGVFVDEFSFLYVADTASNRVVVYSNTNEAPALGSSASFVLGQQEFDSAGEGAGPTGLRGPVDVAVDHSGQVLVSDRGNHRVVVYPSLIFLPISGAAATSAIGQPNLLSSFPNWNSVSGLAAPQGVSAPTGIFLDRNDTLYVSDSGNHRVSHFLKPGVTVNASHFRGDLPVAPGSLVSLFGSGVSTEIAGASTTPLPSVLAGRRVQVDDEFDGFFLFVSPTQANLQLPSGLTPGAHRIAVRVAETGELLAGGPVLVAPASPGFFTRLLEQDDRMHGVVLNHDGSLNAPTRPARRGNFIQLFGTGQGEVSPAVPDGRAAPLGSLSTTVAKPTSDGTACLTDERSVCVAIGSTFGEVLFSGLAPGFVGLWQVNVNIPSNALTGDAIPVRAVISGRPSNIISVAIE